MKLTDLIVSPKSLGDKLWLVDVSPAYEYKDGKRTDTVLGYRYSVALPEKGLDKVDVRIDGQQQAEAPNGYVEVRFDGLEVFIKGKITQIQQGITGRKFTFQEGKWRLHLTFFPTNCVVDERYALKNKFIKQRK